MAATMKMIVFILVIQSLVLFVFSDKVYFSVKAPPGIHSIDLGLFFASFQELELGLQSSINQPIGLDLNPYTSTLYWSDGIKHTIDSYSIETGEQSVLVSTGDGSNVTDIDVDPFGGKLYWSDKVLNTIECINLDGTGRTVLFQLSKDDPTTIAFNSETQYLYWATSGGFKAIYRARIGETKALVTTLNETSGGIDFKDDTIFWIDNYLHKADLDGNNIIVSLQTSFTPVANIAIHGDNVYMTDRNLGGIRWKDINTGSVSSRYSTSFIDHIEDLVYYADPVCAEECNNNGNCEYIEEDVIVGCSCPFGFGGSTCNTIMGYCDCWNP
ncbi:low-density lipoprotein receptor-related protein 5-like [Antedon mediterranea]|uniref:low-density lipoprotein receptor-related protein 5-like n=1 Tax=Antedon mediterranea TaxID=105859 RepID=UPI003AF8657C